MPDLSIEYAVLFVAFVLPGAVSMYVYGLKVPQENRALKDKVLEAICFSLVNFALLFWPIGILLGDGFIATNPISAWAIAFVAFIVLPAFWPFVMIWLLRIAEQNGLIRVQAPTAWDDVFNRFDRNSPGGWIMVELNDGSRVGGRFGTESFASAFPDPGHLFIEEMWTFDSAGEFEAPVDGSPGILLRPTDYRHLRIYRGVEA